MEKKFKVLMGARQVGHTTMLINMINEDFKNGMSVILYGSDNIIRNISKRINNVDRSKLMELNAHHSLDGLISDKVYIFGFESCSGDTLDKLKSISKSNIIYCDKPVLTRLISKIEFEIARDIVIEGKNSISLDNLRLIAENNFNLSEVLYWSNNTLTRSDVELNICNPYYNVFKRLSHISEYECDWSGIVFK